MLSVSPKQNGSHVTELDLHHAHRLSTMGELASGLADDIQQRLTVIANYANGCIHRIENDRITPDELKKLLHKIADTALQANDIAGRAKSYTKKKRPTLESIDLHEAVAHSIVFVRSEAVKHDVTIELQLMNESPTVTADRTQVSQVIVNLLLNSIDSLANHPGQRTVIVETSYDGEESVQVTVADTGPGISRDTQFKVFDPFFTTKPDGLGIGLALCRSIIESHRGHMSLESECGQGTRIGFSLPRVSFVSS